DLDLTFAGEQGNAPHLAQVHAHGVVALVVVVVYGATGARGRAIGDHLFFGLHRGLAGRLVAVGHPVGCDLDVAGVVDDLDLLVVEGAQHVVHLVGADVLARQRLVDVVVREEALALAERDQLVLGPAVALRRLGRRHRLVVIVVVALWLGRERSRRSAAFGACLRFLFFLRRR